jgi:hypothetical protein
MVEYDWEGEDKFMSVTLLPETGWDICMSALRLGDDRNGHDPAHVLLAVGAAVIAAVILVIALFQRSLVIRPRRSSGPSPGASPRRTTRPN